MGDGSSIFSQGGGNTADYSRYSFKELLREEKKYVRTIHKEFVRQNRLDQCFKSLSPLQSNYVLTTLQNLHAILEELSARRKELDSTLFGIPFKAYLIPLSISVYLAYTGSIAFDFTTLFLHCEEAEPLDIAAVACATSAFALTIFNQWGAGQETKNNEKKARLEDCSIDDLPSIKLFNDFLASFAELVMVIQSEKRAKSSLRSSTASGGGRNLHSAPLDFISTKAAHLIKTPLLKRDLTKRCLSRLNAVPDYILEQHTGERADLLRENWRRQLTKMASIHYIPAKNFQEDSCSTYSGPRSFSNQKPIPKDAPIQIDLQASKGSLEAEHLEGFTHHPLHSLLQLYKEKIALFHDEFNLDIYLSRFGLEAGEGDLLSEEFAVQKAILDKFLVAIKELQVLITEKRHQYDSTHCLSWFFTKKNLKRINTLKNISRVLFVGSTAIANVITCEEGFGARDVGKIMGCTAGILCLGLELTSSLVASRVSKIKIRRARAINADTVELQGVDGLSDFMGLFLLYVEEIALFRDLKREFDVGERELKEGRRELKDSLHRCIDSLRTIDASFLEHLVKGNGEMIKEKWEKALRVVFQKVVRDESGSTDGYLRSKAVTFQSDSIEDGEGDTAHLSHPEGFLAFPDFKGDHRKLENEEDFYDSEDSAEEGSWEDLREDEVNDDAAAETPKGNGRHVCLVM